LDSNKGDEPRRYLHTRPGLCYRRYHRLGAQAWVRVDQQAAVPALSWRLVQCLHIRVNDGLVLAHRSLSWMGSW
jgi:hypothetical protein